MILFKIANEMSSNIQTLFSEFQSKFTMSHMTEGHKMTTRLISILVMSLAGPSPSYNTLISSINECFMMSELIWSSNQTIRQIYLGFCLGQNVSYPCRDQFYAHVTWLIHCGSNLEIVISEYISMIKFMNTSCEIALRWKPYNTFDGKSALVQAMAWCRQVTSHYLNQCRPISVSSHGFTRWQWVNVWFIKVQYNLKGSHLPFL